MHTCSWPAHGDACFTALQRVEGCLLCIHLGGTILLPACVPLTPVPGDGHGDLVAQLPRLQKRWPLTLSQQLCVHTRQLKPLQLAQYSRVLPTPSLWSL